MKIMTVKKVLTTYKSKEAGKKALQNYMHLFPIKQSQRLAGIVGDLFCDGHLQGPPKWRFDYTSNSTKELKRFGKEVYSIFGVKGSIRKCTTNKYGTTFNYGVNNKPISRILFLFGAPIGNKVLQPLKIPDWILNNKLIFRRFIQRAFDCEGIVDLDGAIEFQMWKSQKLLEKGFKFFRTIKSKLKEYFNIETTNPFTNRKTNLRKDGIRTAAIRMKIKRKDSIEKFFKCIGFESIKKQQKLMLLVGR